MAGHPDADADQLREALLSTVSPLLSIRRRPSRLTGAGLKHQSNGGLGTLPLGGRQRATPVPFLRRSAPAHLVSVRIHAQTRPLAPLPHWTKTGRLGGRARDCCFARAKRSSRTSTLPLPLVVLSDTVGSLCSDDRFATEAVVSAQRYPTNPAWLTCSGCERTTQRGRRACRAAGVDPPPSGIRESRAAPTHRAVGRPVVQQESLHRRLSCWIVSYRAMSVFFTTVSRSGTVHRSPCRGRCCRPRPCLGLSCSPTNLFRR
jgi:hypothetical protein